MIKLKPSEIGIVVNKSKATKTFNTRELPFMHGSRLNKPYESCFKKQKTAWIR